MLRVLALIVVTAALPPAPPPALPPAPPPIDALVDSHVQCLLGGSKGGQWLEPEKVAPSLKGGEAYRLLERNGPTATATGQKPEAGGAPCDATLDVKLSEQRPDSLALTGKWNVQPRAVAEISGARRDYTKLFGAFLKTRGVSAAASMPELYRVDLDGDGKEEVVAVLSNLKEDDLQNPKGYSAVVVRHIVNGAVTTSVLEFEKAPRSGGLNTYSVPLIADLNGDGTMEIVLYGRYYEGVFTLVYALEGGKFRKVASCACGA